MAPNDTFVFAIGVVVTFLTAIGVVLVMYYNFLSRVQNKDIVNDAVEEAAAFRLLQSSSRRT